MAIDAIRQISLIGFGEVGRIFGQDLAAAGLAVAMYDILLREEPARTELLAKVSNAGVRACDNIEQAMRDAELVISAVTASSSSGVAKEAARSVRPGQIYMDINSVSPETKRQISKMLEPTQAIFVEGAVMAPVPPLRLKVPLLLGGTGSKLVARLLQQIGFNATPVGERVGAASAIKMCRSVVMKGLEALAVESLFAARRFGAEEEVLASLARTYPQLGWDQQLPDYLISRVAEHGRRRATEMREVGETLRSVGLEPAMALATAERQDWLVQQMAERNISYHADEPFSWRVLADAIAATPGARAEAASQAQGEKTAKQKR